MKALRSAPLRPLDVASALQVFIFSCWLLPLAAVPLSADRQVFMKALRSAPASPLLLASALQEVIFSCWLLCVACAQAPCPATSASAAPIPTSHVVRVIRSPWRTGMSQRAWYPQPARLLHVRIRSASALGDETVDARLEHRQRDRAEREHRVVEGADIEALPERLLRVGTSLEDGALPEIVGQCLPRPGDVAVHLGADLALRQRGVLPEIVDRL